MSTYDAWKLAAPGDEPKAARFNELSEEYQALDDAKLREAYFDTFDCDQNEDGENTYPDRETMILDLAEYDFNHESEE